MHSDDVAHEPRDIVDDDDHPDNDLCCGFNYTLGFWPPSLFHFSFSISQPPHSERMHQCTDCTSASDRLIWRTSPSHDERLPKLIFIFILFFAKLFRSKDACSLFTVQVHVFVVQRNGSLFPKSGPATRDMHTRFIVSQKWIIC